METMPKRTSKDDECTVTTMESLKSLIEKTECVRLHWCADQNTLSNAVVFSQIKRNFLAKTRKKESPNSKTPKPKN
jgi:hypothetical protein